MRFIGVSRLTTKVVMGMLSPLLIGVAWLSQNCTVNLLLANTSYPLRKNI